MFYTTVEKITGHVSTETQTRSDNQLFNHGDRRKHRGEFVAFIQARACSDTLCLYGSLRRRAGAALEWRKISSYTLHSTAQKYHSSFDCTHAVIPDFSLLSKFGYTVADIPIPFIFKVEGFSTGDNVVDNVMVNANDTYTDLHAATNVDSCLPSCENICNSFTKSQTALPVYPRLSLCKFFVPAKGDDRYVIVFILFQMFNLSIFTKHTERAHVH